MNSVGSAERGEERIMVREDMRINKRKEEEVKQAEDGDEQTSPRSTQQLKPPSAHSSYCYRKVQ